MMNDTDVKRLNVALNLLRGYDFDPLREYIAQRRADFLNKLTRAENQTDIYRLQGRVCELEGLLKLLSEGPIRQRPNGLTGF